MSEGPRILHVVATLDRGGTEMSALALAGALAARGIGNRTAALRRGAGGIAAALAEVSGPPAVLPDGRLARARAFNALCRQLKPDAVILHFFTLDHVVLALAARAAGVKRIAVKQGNPAPAADRAALARKVALILRLTRLGGVALVSSSRWIETSLAALGALPERARVVHNGCAVAAVAARAAAARAVRTDGEAVVLMVARLDPIKDHATLLAALALVPATVGGRRVRLDLAGDGALRATLEAQAAALGIADRVRVLGARADVPELLGAADVFCLSTTRDEGFGVVLIEALAAGVPVVASDVPACREVLADGALGTLVPAGDAAALAAALARALAAPPDPPSAAAVAARYGVAAMADGYLAALGLPPAAAPAR